MELGGLVGGAGLLFLGLVGVAVGDSSSFEAQLLLTLGFMLVAAGLFQGRTRLRQERG